MCLHWIGMYHIHTCINITYTVSYHIHTLHIQVHTVYIHVHMVYTGTTFICIYHYCICHYILICTALVIWMYYAIIQVGHSVQTGFRQGHTSQEWSGQVASFPVAFSLCGVQTSIHTIYQSTKADIRVRNGFWRNYTGKLSTCPDHYQLYLEYAQYMPLSTLSECTWRSS